MVAGASFRGLSCLASTSGRAGAGVTEVVPSRTDRGLDRRSGCRWRVVADALRTVPTVVARADRGSRVVRILCAGGGGWAWSRRLGGAGVVMRLIWLVTGVAFHGQVSVQPPDAAEGTTWGCGYAWCRWWAG